MDGNPKFLKKGNNYSTKICIQKCIHETENIWQNDRITHKRKMQTMEIRKLKYYKLFRATLGINFFIEKSKPMYLYMVL